MEGRVVAGALECVAAPALHRPAARWAAALSSPSNPRPPYHARPPSTRSLLSSPLLSRPPCPSRLAGVTHLAPSASNAAH